MKLTRSPAHPWLAHSILGIPLARQPPFIFPTLCDAMRYRRRSADASHTFRLVQLGFLLKLAEFFGQAEAREDPKAQELLAHSVWHVSVTLTDIKPIPRPPPLSSSIPVVLSPVLSRGGLQQHQHQYQQKSNVGNRRSSVKSLLDTGLSPGGGGRGVPGRMRSRRRSSGGSSVMSSVMPEANTAQDACGGATSGVVVTRPSPSPPLSDRGRGSMVLRKKLYAGAVGGGGGGDGLASLVAARSGKPTEKLTGVGPGMSMGKGAGGRRILGGTSSIVTEEGVHTVLMLCCFC